MSTSTTTAKRISKGQIEGQFLQFDHHNSTSGFLRIAEIGLLLFLIFLTLCTFIWYGLRYIERESRLQSLRPPVTATNGSSLPGATAAPRLDDLNYQRAQFIRNMTLDAWRTYKAYAWEADALQPVTRSPFNGHGKYSLGRTLVLAMSTLHLMGFEAEFALARRWIRLNVNFANVDAKLPVGEIVQEYLASMLACFALTGDRMFLKKAEEIALMLTPAYSTPTGISYSWINPAVRVAEGRLVTLSASLGQLLEYNYLSRLTENAALVNRTARYRNAIKRYFTRYGLYMTRLNVLEDDDSIRPTSISCFTSASRYFYISLVKSALQNRTDPSLITMFNRAIDSAAKERLFAVSPRSNLRYLHLQKQCPESAPLWYKDHFDPTPEDRLLASWSSPYNRNHSAKYANSMKTSTCYFGGLLFLAADALKGVKSREGKQRREGYCKLGVELTETCHQASLRSTSGLAPAKFYFDGEDEATNGRYRDIIYETGSFLGPELAESYLILWRATHNPKYREAAWELVQAIQAAAHVPTGGYSQLADVNELRPHHTNYQPPHLIGATLKYLYLIFADEGVLRSEDWIFNVAGQPLPVLKL